MMFAFGLLGMSCESKDPSPAPLLHDFTKTVESSAAYNRRTYLHPNLWQTCLAKLNSTAADNPANSGRVYDKWYRDISQVGVLLMDWEGYMGNPEILLHIMAPANATFPVSITVTAASAPRLYLMKGSSPWAVESPSASGPTLTTSSTTSGELIAFYAAVNPDVDFSSETYTLNVIFIDSIGVVTTLDLPIFVCDQDRSRDNDFTFTLGVTHDKTAFYTSHPEAAPLMSRIASDLGYYMDSMNEDRVAVGGGQGRTEFSPDEFQTNATAYKGIYLFSTGWIHGTNPNDIWSTGSPGQTLMTSGGQALPVYSVGVVRPHPDGDRSAVNTTGWSYEIDDDNWWTVSRSRIGDSPTGECTACTYYFVSFYSVMKHELLHALAYETRYSLWNGFNTAGCITDAAVTAFTGVCTTLADSVHAWSPQLHRRNYDQGIELIDKFEVLVLQAVGWKLRDTTPFAKLSALNALKNGTTGTVYSEVLITYGGVPPYYFTVKTGTLPNGLTLNSYTGAISGTPTAAGEFNFTLSIKDYDVNNSVTVNGIDVPLKVRIY